MKQAPVKSILRVGSTRSLDGDAVSMASSATNEGKTSLPRRGGRRADMKRAVSFSVPSRWQNASSDESCDSLKHNLPAQPKGNGLRMPVRRTDDNDDDDNDDSSCASSCSSCSCSTDKGLRMPIRRTDKDEEEGASDSLQDNEPTLSQRKPKICNKAKAQLRMPARNTFSGDEGSAVEFKKRPFAMKRANSFNTLKKPPIGSMTLDVHHISV